MNELYIYHHLGLGDHIILNGFVRHVAESYDRVWLFAKPGNNTRNVKRMYQDNSKIKIIPLDDAGSRDHMRMFSGNKYMMVGHTAQFFKDIDNPTNGKTFDELFYNQHNIPFEYKWDKFYLQRDLDREKEVYYDILGLKDNEEYLFVHDDYRNEVKTKGLPDNIKIIKPHNYLDITVYDFLLTIEKSKEVHMMNSGFLPLVDCIQLKHDNLNYHEYLRPGTVYKTKLNWKIIA